MAKSNATRNAPKAGDQVNNTNGKSNEENGKKPKLKDITPTIPKDFRNAAGDLEITSNAQCAAAVIRIVRDEKQAKALQHGVSQYLKRLFDASTSGEDYLRLCKKVEDEIRGQGYNLPRTWTVLKSQFKRAYTLGADAVQAAKSEQGQSAARAKIKEMADAKKQAEKDKALAKRIAAMASEPEESGEDTDSDETEGKPTEKGLSTVEGLHFVESALDSLKDDTVIGEIHQTVMELVVRCQNAIMEQKSQKARKAA